MTALQPLIDVRDRGAMPRDGQIFMALGIPLKRRKAITIPFDELPTDQDSTAVAGLDVILCFYGYLTRYGILRRLCGSLLAGRPRRLIVIDLDLQKIAHLKTDGRP